MMANLKYWLKGLAVAALSMVVYAGALGCYIALMLLVISMEEGGDNLSAFSVSLTEAVVLLSQGNGFKTGSITLTIMPLLLTVLLIALIASLAKRVGTSLSGCVAGTIGWVLINVFFANSLDIKLVDTTGVVAVKTAIVFVLGYAIAAIPESPLTKRDLDWISEHVSSPVRKTVTIGVALGVLLITVYLVIGLIVVLYWAVGCPILRVDEITSTPMCARCFEPNAPLEMAKSRLEHTDTTVQEMQNAPAG